MNLPSRSTLWRALIAIALALIAPHLHSTVAGTPHVPWEYIIVVGAVTPITMTELNNLAKDYFTNVYVQLVNPETALKAQFAKLENAQFTGRIWIFGVKTMIGGGSANAGANKTLPKARAGQYAQGQANVVRTYTRMSLDGLAIEVTKKQQGSYRPALAEVMSDRLQQHDLEVNRQLYCGGLGVVATVGTGVASATQTMNQDYGVANGGLGTRHLYIGDDVEFYDPTLVTKRAGGPFTITAVDHVAVTVGLSASVTTTTGDVIVRATVDTDNTIALEANGLLVTVKDTGTFETIVATGPWKSVRLHNSGTLRDVSDPLVMQAIEQIRARSRVTPDLAVTRPGIILKYSEIFLPLRRLDGQDVQLKGGYKPLAALVHAGGSIPVIGDLDAPNSRLFLLSTGAFRLADIVGTDWADMDGATFDRVVDKDAIEGYIRKYWQLITVQRNANGVVEDLNDIGAIDKAA